jgi:DNA-binding NtrC family response regulator
MTLRMTIGNSWHVLLVDDDPSILRLYTRRLSTPGLTLTSVSSGDEAMQTLREVSFSAVVSDINMPLMSGLDLLHAMRHAGVETPVILITACATLESAIAGLDCRAFRYLSKPVNFRLLADTVHRAIQFHEERLNNRTAQKVLQMQH